MSMSPMLRTTNRPAPYLLTEAEDKSITWVALVSFSRIDFYSQSVQQLHY